MTGSDRERPHNPLLQSEDVTADPDFDASTRRWDIISALAAVTGIVLIVILIITA